MELEDSEWPSLLGGYGVPYDPRQAIWLLEQGGDVAAAWRELWTELHHQGDVGTASYAALPHLVRVHEIRGVADWNTYALAATIEDVRHNGRNPDMPGNLLESYRAAWGRLVDIGLRELATTQEPTLVASIIGVLAIGKGQPVLGRLAVCFDEDERRAMLRASGCW